MKISLIQPRWRIELDSLNDPLNLAYLSGYLKNKGYKNIKIYSSVFDSDRKIVNQASSSDIVGLTVTSSMLYHASNLAILIKKKNPNSKIIFGGVHPSVAPASSLLNKYVDCVVRGEGEVTFYELIKAFEQKKDLSKVRGISYNADGKIFHNEDRELISNIDTIPYPDRKLLDQKSFLRRYYKIWGFRAAAMLTSRGCPYNCSCCCSDGVWKSKWRARSPESVVNELEQLVKDYKLDVVQFADANLVLDTARISKICSLIKKNNINVLWHCLAYPKNLDKELLKEMKSAGCEFIGLGVESGSYRILKEYGKSNINLTEVKTIFKNMKDVGIFSIAFFVLGFPSENYFTIEETKKLIKDLQPDFATCSALIPFPGTVFYKRAKENGYFKDEDFRSLRYGKAYMPSDHLSKQELTVEYKKILKEFSYFWRKRKISFWPVYYKIKMEFINDIFCRQNIPLFTIFNYVFLRMINKVKRIFTN